MTVSNIAATGNVSKVVKRAPKCQYYLKYVFQMTFLNVADFSKFKLEVFQKLM